jgi:hypothetical protein
VSVDDNHGTYARHGRNNGEGTNMYKAFDKFLAVSTWHTNHDADGERFYLALHQVVKRAAFSPDEMADYMHQKISVPRGGANNYSNEAIGRYTTAAWAVRDYLKATGAI